MRDPSCRSISKFKHAQSNVFALSGRCVAPRLSRSGVDTKTESLFAHLRVTEASSVGIRLIAIAFFLARGFIKTGLGNRIAYMIVSIFGSTTL
eukprot:1105030-Pyramimonas_sp.AAC.2